MAVLSNTEYFQLSFLLLCCMLCHSDVVLEKTVLFHWTVFANPEVAQQFAMLLAGQGLPDKKKIRDATAFVGSWMVTEDLVLKFSSGVFLEALVYFARGADFVAPDYLAMYSILPIWYKMAERIRGENFTGLNVNRIVNWFSSSVTGRREVDELLSKIPYDAAVLTQGAKGVEEALIDAMHELEIGPQSPTAIDEVVRRPPLDEKDPQRQLEFAEYLWIYYGKSREKYAPLEFLKAWFSDLFTHYPVELQSMLSDMSFTYKTYRRFLSAGSRIDKGNFMRWASNYKGVNLSAYAGVQGVRKDFMQKFKNR